MHKEFMEAADEDHSTAVDGETPPWHPRLEGG